MSDELAKLIAKRFISRKDVKAIQHPGGAYSPHARRDNMGHEIERYPWRKRDILAHLSGEQSFGHYLLNTDNTCKLFAFDIDLEKTGWYCTFEETSEPVPCNPREAWLDRKHPGRPWFKYQLKIAAAKLMRSIHQELEIPTAAAYSGGKGVHVYGFTGPMKAADVREGASIVLESVGEWEQARGEHFFKHRNQAPMLGYPNLSLEVFPKQTNLDGKDLGNLMRLPLGRNLKSKDPTFFIDMTSGMSEMLPVDPVYALTTTNPWRRPGE